MIRISETLRDIVKGNPFLEFGVHHGLFNLTQLARYLQPQVEARAMKEVQVSAITMNLSRLQRRLAPATPAPERFVIDNVTIHSGLSTVTYPRNPEVQAKLNALYNRIHEEGGFCSLSQGLRELTAIFESRFRPELGQQIRQPPLYEHERLASVGVQFGARYADIPGMLYMLLQRVTLQNINLIEITSTYTEIIFFIDETDTRTVFDTLFQSFLVRGTRAGV